MIELKHIERFYPLAKGQFFYVLRDVNLKIEEGDFVSIRKAEGGAVRDSRPCLSLSPP
jgi:ABC-type lipoprotein export system ATPase subunit